MTFLERVTQAVEVVSFDSPEGTLRQQAEGLLGTEIDNETSELLQAMAENVGAMVFEAYLKKDVNPITAVTASRMSILIAGIAVGKRLGVEEGQEFGRLTASLLEQP